jgi:hypothetical protein
MTALLTDTIRDLAARLSRELQLRKNEVLKEQELRHLASTAEILAGATLSTWAWVRETLEGKGFEGRELAGHCEAVLAGIDQSLTAH